MAPTPHAIPRTEVHHLRATEIDQEYRVSVALPRSYERRRHRYPVLIVLDADIGFGTAVEGHRLMSLDDGLEEVLIVGIGYPVDDLQQTLVVRTRDLTPSVDQAKLAELSAGGLGDDAASFIGGADRFLAFIEHELLPFLGARYRADTTDLGIAGSSFGGLFGVWCLFEHPGVFGRYLLTSPSLWWDTEVAFRYERSRWTASHELEARLFMSVGGSEATRMVAPFRRLVATLRRRRYHGLRLTSKVFRDETHRSVGGGAMWRGLLELYPGSRPPD
jgi:hypothetical protein